MLIVAVDSDRSRFREPLALFTRRSEKRRLVANEICQQRRIRRLIRGTRGERAPNRRDSRSLLHSRLNRWRANRAPPRIPRIYGSETETRIIF